MSDTPWQLLDTKELLENLKNDLESMEMAVAYYQKEALKKVKSLETLLDD